MLSELQSLNLKLCSKQYNKIFLLRLIVVGRLSSGWWHNYSTKSRPPAGCTDECKKIHISKVAPKPFIFSNEGKSAVGFCCQVAAWFPDMFCNFNLVKYYIIAKHTTTTKARKNKHQFGILRILETFWWMFD